MNLADELRVALSRALDEATKRRHEFLTLEHVLLALLHVFLPLSKSSLMSSYFFSSVGRICSAFLCQLVSVMKV